MFDKRWYNAIINWIRAWLGPIGAMHDLLLALNKERFGGKDRDLLFLAGSSRGSNNFPPKTARGQPRNLSRPQQSKKISRTLRFWWTFHVQTPNRINQHQHRVELQQFNLIEAMDKRIAAAEAEASNLWCSKSGAIACWAVFLRRFSVFIAVELHLKLGCSPV